MFRKASPSLVLMMTAGIAVLGATAPAMAGNGFSFTFTPNAKEAKALSRGFSLYSAAKNMRNSARVEQQGSGNAAGVSQSGSGNSAGIFQFGKGHSATVAQNGNNNSFGLLQLGRNRTSNVTQNGNSSSFVVQGGW